MSMEYSTQWAQVDGLVEYIPAHVCHVNGVTVDAILSYCEHQEEESLVGHISLFGAHINKWAANIEVI